MANIRQENPSSRVPVSRLTFGVELEFTIAVLEDGEIDPHPQDPRSAKVSDNLPLRYRHQTCNLKSSRINLEASIAEALIAAGLPSVTSEVAGYLGLISTSWHVGNDSSIDGPPGKHYHEQYRYETIELRSPPYYYSSESVRLIQKACRILTSTFRCHINASAGLHVHVGSGNSGFSHTTLRNLIMFLYAFEPQLSNIHPPARRNGGFCLTMRDNFDTFDPDDRYQFIEQEPAPCRREMTTLEALELIYDSPDINSLIAKVCRYKSYAYNFRNVMVPNSELKPTIEWRGHRGTLDAERVAAWIKLCVGVVEFAQEVDEKDLVDFVCKHYSRSKKDLAERSPGESSTETSAEKTSSTNETEIDGAELGLIELLDKIELFEPARYYENNSWEQMCHCWELKDYDEEDEDLYGCSDEELPDADTPFEQSPPESGNAGDNDTERRTGSSQLNLSGSWPLEDENPWTLTAGASASKPSEATAQGSVETEGQLTESRFSEHQETEGGTRRKNMSDYLC